MANILLKIGSVFNGEGLLKLKNATKSANDQVKKASSVATNLSGALVQLDTSGSKCATALTGLISAFTSGGIAGVAFTGVMMGINAYFDDQLKKVEELRKAVAEMGKQVMATFSSTLTAKVSGVLDEVKSVTDSFDRATAAAKAFSGAITSFGSSQAAEKIINLEIAKFQAVLDAASTAEAKHAESAYALQIQEAKNALANDEAAERVNAASAALKASEEREVVLSTNRQAVAEELANVEDVLATTDKGQVEVRKQLGDKIRELKKTLEGIDRDIEDQTNKSMVLFVEEQTAIQNMTNKRLEGEAAINQLNAALKMEALAAEKAARAEEQAMSDKIDKQVTQLEIDDNKERLADATKKLADARQEAAQATADIKAAEQNLKTAIENYNANIGQNMAQDVLRDYYSNTNFNSNLQNGFGAVMKAIPEIGKAGGQAAVDAAVAQGKIRSTQDYDKIFNAAARQSRIDAYKDSAKANSDDAMAKRILGKSEKARSDWEKDWLEKYKATQESRNKDAADKALAEQQKIDAETRLRTAQEKIGNIADDISQINQRLANLGLK